jgi:hypothetical protein
VIPNLRNLDWKHIVALTITLVISFYNVLVANGVSFPVQVGSIILMLTSIGNMLRQSPVATPQQIAARATRADLRALQVNREDQTK